MSMQFDWMEKHMFVDMPNRRCFCDVVVLLIGNYSSNVVFPGGSNILFCQMQ